MRPDGRVEAAEMGALYPESSPGADPLPPAVPAGNGSGIPAGGDPGQRGALLRPDEGEQRPAGGAGLHAGRENVVRQRYRRAGRGGGQAVQLCQQRGLRRGLQDPRAAAEGGPLPRRCPHDRPGAVLQRHHPALYQCAG